MFRTKLQETFVIRDASFYDTGVSGTKNNKWVNQSNCWSVSSDSTGTTLTEINSGNYTPSTTANTTNWNNRLLFTTNTCVEFYVSDTDTAMFRVVSGSTQKTFPLTNGHYKFLITDGEIRYWIDGVEQTKVTDSNITGDIGYSFVASNDSKTSILKYKDFVVYSI